MFSTSHLNGAKTYQRMLARRLTTFQLSNRWVSDCHWCCIRHCMRMSQHLWHRNAVSSHR